MALAVFECYQFFQGTQQQIPVAIYGSVDVLGHVDTNPRRCQCRETHRIKTQARLKSENCCDQRDGLLATHTRVMYYF